MALPATVDEAAVAMICADVMVQMQNSFDWRAANRSAETIPRTYLPCRARQEVATRVQRGANAAHRNQHDPRASFALHRRARALPGRRRCVLRVRRRRRRILESPNREEHDEEHSDHE